MIQAYVWQGDMPVAVMEGGQVYSVRVDHIGRPAFATTSAGTVVWSASYLPFGGVNVTIGAPIDLRFPGQWFQTGEPDQGSLQWSDHPANGLYQNWMRDYDPTLGRYIEADPLGLVDGASVYGYARQNPGRWVDPRGELSVSDVRNAARSILCILVPSACITTTESIASDQICVPDEEFELSLPPNLNSSFPPGYWPGDRGAAEWGRRNGYGAKEGKDKFHKLKQKNPGSGANEDFGVDPESGDVVDGNGEPAGNLNDED